MILAPALNATTPTTPTPPMPRRRFLGGLLSALAGGSLLGQARAAFAAPASTTAQTPFIGELSIVGFNFAPLGWALCDGTLLPIASNTALFALLGTTFGGNGVSTFALPDLRGRFPLHMTGSYPMGLAGGEAIHVLTGPELPPHAHALMVDGANGTSDTPAGGFPARNPAGIPAWSAAGPATAAAGAIGNYGSGQAHNNLPPYLSLNFIIATQGIFPTRA
jgi:microcystin-dependent protein